MLELYPNFDDKFCDLNKFEESEIDTDSPYLALAEENLNNCIQPEKKETFDKMRENDCRNAFKADAKSKLISFIERVAVSIKNVTNGSRG